MTADLRRRPQPSAAELSDSKLAPSLETSSRDGTDEVPHPSGREKNSRLTQFLRGFSFVCYFFSCCVAINITQFIGAPLYWFNRDLYYAYMALTKESFGLLITTMTNVWGPTTIRISGDHSVAGQIRRTPDGRVEFDFPERMVMIANHQVRLADMISAAVIVGNDCLRLTKEHRSIPTGCTCGGLAMRTNPTCTATCTSSSRNHSNTSPSSGRA